MKTALSIITKLAVTAGCFYLIWRSVDLETALAQVQSVSAFVFVLCVLIFLSQLFPIALRWRYFAQHLGAEMRVVPSVQVVGMGHFLNQTFLGTIAGDAARTAFLVQRGATIARAFASIVLDRYVALLTIWVGAGLTTPLLWIRDQDAEIMNAMVAFLALIGCALAAVPIGGAVADNLPLAKRLRVDKPLAAVKKIADVFQHALHDRGSWLTVFGGSAYVLVSSGLITWIFATDLDLGLSLGTMMAITPVALLLAAIPISIGGWGLRELSFVSLIVATGGTSEDGLVLSLLFGFSSLVSGLVCGLVWVAWKA